MASTHERSRSVAAQNAPPDLAGRLRQLIADAPCDRPLPTTRKFGHLLRVANTTVFRTLQKLTEEGEIWQHPTSGRYYLASARALLDRPKPVACLIRRLELGSAQYRELLEGISLGCGALHRTMLLWHDELLVNHPEPNEPPIFAPVAQQRMILTDFTNRHGNAAGGFIFDHVWSDAALRQHRSTLVPAVVLFRSCMVEGFSNVRADFRAGSLKALTHLLGRGFEQIVPVEPFEGDPAVSEFMTALTSAAAETGCANRLGPLSFARTVRERVTLIGRLARARPRTALICPEDNIAILLAKAASDAGLVCPRELGIISVMGTGFATKAGVSCLRYDFRAMGRLAVEALGREPTQHVLEPTLISGATT